jgi:hypothetical protein
MTEKTGAEVATPPAAEPEAGEPKVEVKTDQDAEFWKGKASAMEKDAKKAFDKLARLEKAEKERADAELSETEKLKQKLAEVEKRAAEAERKALCQKIAAETGLPALLAERLQGDDEEAMRADAAKLLETLPKQPEPDKKIKNPVINPTNPGGASVQETPEQKKARLHYTEKANIWDPEFVEKSGGGAYISES